MTSSSGLWVCTAPIGRADKNTSPELIAADATVRIYAEEADPDRREPPLGILYANVRGLPGPSRVSLCQGYGLGLTHEAPTRLAMLIAQHRSLDNSSISEHERRGRSHGVPMGIYGGLEGITSVC